jgi:hypothetical protein
MAGPALVVPAAVGALVGSMASKLRDTGFSDDRLKMLGESLQPESSAIVAVVEHRWVQQLEEEMEEVGADVFTAALSADIAEQLATGHEVAYTAIADEYGFAAGRVAAGEEDVEGGYIIEDETGMSASRFMATQDGFAVLSVDVDDDEIAMTGVAGEFPQD